MVPAVQFQHVSRHFGDVRAVEDVSFEVADGEFFAMLGPSGSGKTTCLRLIAGFEQPDAGHILIQNRNSDGIPPYERDVNTVFQDYAIFPHMSVAENVTYSLMIKGIPRVERYRRGEEMLELVKLGGLGGRKSAQLSGGQRQRVALARALVNQPRVLLLDEPLGALDLKLREQMQVELKALQRQIGITFIYVTHDQGEALSMSDRLAVFNHGRIEQIGGPQDIYEHPVTRFVASFVGLSNILEGEVAQRVANSTHPFSIRPENIRFSDRGVSIHDDVCTVSGAVTDVQYHGANTRYQVALNGGGALTVVCQNARRVRGTAGIQPGEVVHLEWDRVDVQPLSIKSG